MKKQLRFTGGIEELSFEEVLKKFEIYRTKTKYEWSRILWLDVDDAGQLIDIEIWKAYRDYNISLNTNFITTVYKYVDQKQRNLWKSSQVASRKNEFGDDVYLDTKLSDDEDDYYKLAKDGEFEDGLISLIEINNILERYKPNKKLTVQMLLQGYQIKEIRQVVNLSHTTILKYKNEFVRALEV
ncbi:MAG: hypothetical protein Q8936_21990 [Bacillota bacterium]|nr:hypothetical protein [Bacillota bacterium]